MMSTEYPGLTELRQCLAEHDQRLSDEALAKLLIYLKMLVKWNKSINLTGPGDWETILRELVLDSFYLDSFLNKQVSEEKMRVILDLGAGAGLPGIPLRLVWETGDYYLVESRLKRAAFMTQAIGAMDLENTCVLNCRCEELDQGLLPADMIISRAFMPWPRLLPLAGNMLRKDGLLIVLSLEKYADQPVPGFSPAGMHEYRVRGAKRYFWALRSNI